MKVRALHSSVTSPIEPLRPQLRQANRPVHCHTETLQMTLSAQDQRNRRALPSAGLLRKLHIAPKVISAQGFAWALKRVQFVLQHRSGILKRRTPIRPWRELTLASVLTPGIPAAEDTYLSWRSQHLPGFLFSSFCPESGQQFIGADSIRQADDILRGRFPFFSTPRELGFPPSWRRAVNGSGTAAEHWTKVRLFESGDIKLAWEPNRFSWAFTLARAYLRSGDNRYAEGFWQLFENWLEANPPNCGLNWVCGQEVAFRIMALCFAYHAFIGSPSTTPFRVARFAIAVAIYARRIDAHIEYAISQKNNHGISECAGLWTVGVLFPELQGAGQFTKRGLSGLIKELRRQCYADGSYIQHSFNYHRVLLQDLAWAIRLGEINGTPLPPEVYEALRRSTRFLHQVTDRTTGWAPNYGANDGALVLPLSDCAYPDMRPVLQSCSFIGNGQALFPHGPWDEELVWMNGMDALGAKAIAAPEPEADLDAVVGGYYTIRSKDSWLMMKGGKYRDRPCHADQLHVDGWWKGINILCDPGTYSYNAPPPFDEGFSATRHHNTVVVDGRDQMTRLSRFLWGDWADAEIRRTQKTWPEVRELQGRHDGYDRSGVSHRRLVAQIDADVWIVVDDVIGQGSHECRLHWVTPDFPFNLQESGVARLSLPEGEVSIRLACSAAAQFDCVRAGQRASGKNHLAADRDRGWISRYYAQRDPALSFVLQAHSLLPVRFVTVVSLGGTQPAEVEESLEKIVIGSRRIAVSPIGSPAMCFTSYEARTHALSGG